MEQVLTNAPNNIHFLIPNACYLEALIALENEEKRLYQVKSRGQRPLTPTMNQED